VCFAPDDDLDPEPTRTESSYDASLGIVRVQGCRIRADSAVEDDAHARVQRASSITLGRGSTKSSQLYAGIDEDALTCASAIRVLSEIAPPRSHSATEVRTFARGAALST
jgi:hypothetical protein